MAKRYDPNDKVVFITGAARGIGLATAQRLSARGAKLVLVGLEAELLEREAAALPGQAAWFHADVTDREAMRSAAEGAIERFGGIDVVIANAGLSSAGTVRSTTDTGFDRTVAVNLTGVWNTLRCAHDSVVQRQGYFLTIASLSAITPAPAMGPYTATKAAVENLGRALHSEVAYTGARSGVAYFGFIDTDLVRHSHTYPAFEAANKTMPKFLSTAVPVDHAARAIERGVDRRALSIYAPGWVRAMRYGTGFLPPLLAMSAKTKATKKVVELSDAEAWEANDPADANIARDPANV